ncbi:MAG: hypothetical protein JRH15_18850 [Deltaproteobacteria bacterium]|nr:hypothetical protein [Deltaproteobacteria bacterium]
MKCQMPAMWHRRKCSYMRYFSDDHTQPIPKYTLADLSPVNASGRPVNEPLRMLEAGVCIRLKLRPGKLTINFQIPLHTDLNRTKHHQAAPHENATQDISA